MQQSDKWSNWLLTTRFGGNKEFRDRTLEVLSQIRDRIITNADIGEGQTVLDIGTGDGLLGFKAAELVGPNGRVILADISEAVIEHLKEFTQGDEGASNIELLVSSVDDLSAIPSESVDRIIARAVMIYVADKQKCFDEFFRILKPGGKISVCEPINKRLQELKRPGYLFGYSIAPLGEVGERVIAEYNKNLPVTSTMSDFNEHDLFLFARNIGFDNIKLNYELSFSTQAKFPAWEIVLNSRPNPNSPTLDEILLRTLNKQEIETFIDYLKPKVENEFGFWTTAQAFLHAQKN